MNTGLADLFIDHHGKAFTGLACPGRLNAVYYPESSSLKYTIVNLKLDKKLKILDLSGTKAGMYCLFSKQDKGKFIDKFNQVHGKVISTVNYMDLVTSYLD